MQLKDNPQGYLVYGTMGLYAAAWVLTVLRRARAGWIAFGLGFATALAAFVYRWLHVQHWPMQNLFEVFLSLGVCSFPLALLARRYLRVGLQGADMLIGFLVLFPAGFVFSAEPQQLPPALQSHLFVPHVAVYMVSYALMAKAFALALTALWPKLGGVLFGHRADEQGLLAPEPATYVTVCLGFPLLTLGLLLGSLWGKFAWGDYWGWDPKELWSLATWMMYLLYLHFRFRYGTQRPKINSLLAVLGFVCVVITLLWVNLSRLFPGLHNYAS